MRNSNPFIDIIIVAAGLFFIGLNLNKDKVNSTSDLKEIKGTVQYYSFIEEKEGRNHTYSYYIYLNEYIKPFQITADIVDWFDKVKFEHSVKQGDSLKMLISKYDYNKIGSKEKAITFGIENDKKEFLNAENAIREYNSNVALSFGFAFVIVGLILLYLDIKRRKKKKIEEEKNRLLIE